MASVFARVLRSAAVLRPAQMHGVRHGASVASDFSCFITAFRSDVALPVVFGASLFFFGYTGYSIS